MCYLIEKGNTPARSWSQNYNQRTRTKPNPSQSKAYTMDAIHAQLANIRTKIDDVPVLQKLEVSWGCGRRWLCNSHLLHRWRVWLMCCVLVHARAPSVLALMLSRAWGIFIDVVIRWAAAFVLSDSNVCKSITATPLRLLTGSNKRTKRILCRRRFRPLWPPRLVRRRCRKSI